jgi:uncharacterized protein (DUF433 family)
MVNWRERISVNPFVCQGKACIRDTRVLVSVVIGNIVAGISRSEILQSYPVLQDSAIDAALVYAAGLAREGSVDLPLQIKA